MPEVTAAALRDAANELDVQAQGVGSVERHSLLVRADTLRGTADAMDDDGVTLSDELEQRSRRLPDREKRRVLVHAKINRALGTSGYGEDDPNFILPPV